MLDIILWITLGLMLYFGFCIINALMIEEICPDLEYQDKYMLTLLSPVSIWFVLIGFIYTKAEEIISEKDNK